MKRYLILLLLISFCGGSSATITDEVTTTVVAPTSSTSTSTSTTIAKVGEEVKASELVIGDCFNEDGADGYYLSESTVVERVACDVLHEFEVISAVNYISDEDTEFNDEGVPNLEIYNACENSYSDKYARDIGGTSTYLTWIGDLQDFNTEKSYLCFVAIFDFIDGPQELDREYERFLYARTKNFVSKKLSDVEVGECFWKRRPDVDLFYSTEVDVLPCNEVHSHEIVGKFDFPDDDELVSESDYYLWAFNACYDLSGIYRTITYYEEGLENFGVRTYSMYDFVAFQTGDQTQAICVSHLHYGFDTSSDVWHKQVSFKELYDYWIVDNEIYFESEENVSVVNLSCPTQEEIDEDAYITGFLFTVVTEHRPIQNITFSYVDNGIEYFVDFTETYNRNKFDTLPVSIVVYESFYLFMRSERSFEDTMKLESGEFSVESATLSVTDAQGEILEATCEF
jgi:hypothetical protein